MSSCCGGATCWDLSTCNNSVQKQHRASWWLAASWSPDTAEGSLARINHSTVLGTQQSHNTCEDLAMSSCSCSLVCRHSLLQMHLCFYLELPQPLALFLQYHAKMVLGTWQLRGKKGKGEAFLTMYCIWEFISNRINLLCSFCIPGKLFTLTDTGFAPLIELLDPPKCPHFFCIWLITAVGNCILNCLTDTIGSWKWKTSVLSLHKAYKNVHVYTRIYVYTTLK